jgi:hypothetical protein
MAGQGDFLAPEELFAPFSLWKKGGDEGAKPGSQSVLAE